MSDKRFKDAAEMLGFYSDILKEAAEKETELEKTFFLEHIAEVEEIADWLESISKLDSSAMARLGQKGGLKGGVARANSLTPERRAEIAKKAAAARWKK